MKDVFLYGGGGHAKVVVECLHAQGITISGFVDDHAAAQLFHLVHLGSYRPEMTPGACVILAIGNNRTRKKISERIGHVITNAIHPSALVSPSAKLETGAMIFHRAILQADVVLGKHVIVNTAAQVDHDCTIRDFAHIGPGAILCGGVSVGEGTLIGAGAVILPGIKIGKWATIGAGAVVTRPVADDVTVTGLPAQPNLLK